MKNFINRITDIVSKYSEHGISIPITPEMILYMLKKKELQDIENLDVTFEADAMKVTGVVRKLKVPVVFSITLIPERVLERNACFRMEKMTPIQAEWINRRIFNRPPYFSYEKGMINIDLNQIPQIQKIAVGKLIDCKIQDGKLWVKIGV